MQCHSGAPIVTPFVLENVYGAAAAGWSDADLSNHVEAVIVWQDTPQAEPIISKPLSIKNITSSGYDGHGSVPFICFEVDRGLMPAEGAAVAGAGIREGNILIAIRDYATKVILWSWHIWITAQDTTPQQVMTEGSGRPSNWMLGYNLGWCEADVTQTTIYAQRVWYVRVNQVYGDATPVVFRVIQLGDEVVEKLSGDSGTYYQWGRKDPLLPSSGTNDMVVKDAFSPSSLPIYGIATETIHGRLRYKGVYMGSGLTSDDASWSIQYPYAYLFNNGNWMNNNHPTNIWNMDNGGVKGGDIAVRKTVYDPCPPDYCVPHKMGFSYFSNVTDRVYGDFQLGWNYLTGYGNTSFFSASGAYGADGTVGNVCWAGFYWTAAPSPDLDGPTGPVKGAHHLDFNPVVSLPANRNNRSYGFSVRPVLE